MDSEVACESGGQGAFDVEVLGWLRSSWRPASRLRPSGATLLPFAFALRQERRPGRRSQVATSAGPGHDDGVPRVSPAPPNS